MGLKLKVIKSKEFTANDEKHTHFTCAYRGRVFGVSTLKFEDKEFVVKDNVLELKTDVEVIKRTVADDIIGDVRTFLDLVPKLGLELASI